MSKKYQAEQENTAALEKTISAKPEKPVESENAKAADRLSAELTYNDKFKYDPQKDPLYDIARQSYTRSASEAMNNTLGASAALTGGFANSWGQSAAQREYDRVMSSLSDVIPELYNAAYSAYNARRAEKMSLIDKYRAADKEQYGRYRDDIADWKNARDYYYKLIRDDVKDKADADEFELQLAKFLRSAAGV